MVTETRKPAPRPPTCVRCNRPIAWLPCPHCQKTGQFRPEWNEVSSQTAPRRHGLEARCPFCDGRGWISELHLACHPRRPVPRADGRYPEGRTMRLQHQNVPWGAAQTGHENARAATEDLLLFALILAALILLFIALGVRPFW